jgi:hypothetical protein
MVLDLLFFNGEEYKEMASGCQLKIGEGSEFKVQKFRLIQF